MATLAIIAIGFVRASKTIAFSQKEVVLEQYSNNPYLGVPGPAMIRKCGEISPTAGLTSGVEFDDFNLRERSGTSYLRGLSVAISLTGTI